MTGPEQSAIDAVDPLDVEIERQRSAWLAFVRGRTRRPTPTPAEKRRAAAITFDDSPRKALVAAWRGATNADRLAIIAQITKDNSDER